METRRIEHTGLCFRSISKLHESFVSHTLSLRIRLKSGARIGPGKVRLLELIAETGSISAAGREMNMSYRRAWLLVESLNQDLGRAVVETRKGGNSGGGTRVTATGHELIKHYRNLERKTLKSGDADLAALERLAQSSQ